MALSLRRRANERERAEPFDAVELDITRWRLEGWSPAAAHRAAALRLRSRPAREHPAAMHVEVSEHAERVLRKLQPASDLAGSIEAVTLDALRMRLRDVVERMGAFEARHGARSSSSLPSGTRGACQTRPRTGSSGTSWIGKR